MNGEIFKKFLLSDSSVTIIGTTFKSENFLKLEDGIEISNQSGY